MGIKIETKSETKTLQKLLYFILILILTFALHINVQSRKTKIVFKNTLLGGMEIYNNPRKIKNKKSTERSWTKVWRIAFYNLQIKVKISVLYSV